MKLEPGELQEKGYTLLDTMDHVAIVPFVKENLNRKTWFSLLYYASITISFALLLFFCMQFCRSGGYTIDMILFRVFSGLLFFIIVIPLHELIHALAYTLMGAKQTSYDMNLKKFYFLAIADKFVAGKREFTFVALAPFVIISSALLVTSFLTGGLWKVTMLTGLTIHSTLCSGDFALLSYFEFNRRKEVVTYDDKANRISFFYGKEG